MDKKSLPVVLEVIVVHGPGSLGEEGLDHDGGVVFGCHQDVLALRIDTSGTLPPVNQLVNRVRRVEGTGHVGVGIVWLVNVFLQGLVN